MRQAAPSDVDTDLNGKRLFVATAQYSSPEYLVRKNWGDVDEVLKALSIYQVGATLHDLIMKRPIFSEYAALENKYALALSIYQFKITLQS
jgi:serine/threonine-protein kinase